MRWGEAGGGRVGCWDKYIYDAAGGRMAVLGFNDNGDNGDNGHTATCGVLWDRQGGVGYGLWVMGCGLWVIGYGL
jgi:hypothetical protein